MPQSSLPSRPTLLALLLVFALIWFGSLDARKLVRPDEGRYAEIPREMVATGDWVTPRLNDLNYFEKPPLQYWMTAIAYTVFGEHHWTARLWTALTGFLGVLLLYATARRLYGAETGIAAAAILGGMQWYLLNAHFNTLDLGLAFFMEATLAGFLLAQHDGAGPGEQRNWMLFAWAAMAAAVLSKGLVGVVLPGSVLVLYTLIERDWALWRRLHIVSGLALFLLLAAPWFVLCSLRNPEFFHFFFIHEHFERYLLPEHRREGVWYYFVPILGIGCLPWLVHLLRLAPGMWTRTDNLRADGQKSFQPRRMLVIWAVFIFAFFSASSSKLPSYILPIFPALALLIAGRLPALPSRAFAWFTLPLALLVAALVPFIPNIESYASEDMPVQMFIAYEPWLYAAAGTFLLGSAIAIALAWRDRKLYAVIALAFASLASGMLVMTGHDAFAPATSSYHLVRGIVAEHGEFRKGLPFYSVNMYEQTLPFYIKRPVTLVDYGDELELGLQQEPHKGMRTQEEFARTWTNLTQGYAIMDPNLYQQFAADGLPMRVLGRDSRRVILSRR